MKAAETYEAICKTLGADARIQIVRADFDDMCFGNFIIAFRLNGQPRSIVNDRGQLLLCDDLSGGEVSVELLPSLDEVEEDHLRQALVGALA